MKRIPSIESFITDQHDPYRALWCGVIAQAFMDTAWHPIEGMSHNTQARGVDCRAARTWFEKAPEGFRLICEAAGFDWRYVQRKYKESFKNGLYKKQEKLCGDRGKATRCKPKNKAVKS